MTNFNFFSLKFVYMKFLYYFCTEIQKQYNYGNNKSDF